MDCTFTRIPYRQTNYFTPIVLDYLDQSEKLADFFSHAPDVDGLRQAIEARRKFPTNRQLLVKELTLQYNGLVIHQATQSNLDALLNDNTFTVTTAHQPNIFTGPLYFLYKILHTIRLAESLKKNFPSNQFVPVYYMGSEDADLDELGHAALDGQLLEWKTKQTGSVGRMLVDQELLNLINIFEGQLSAEPFGRELTELIRAAYQQGQSIQSATFYLVNALFGRYGIIVLIPDNANLKTLMHDIFQDDLLNQLPSAIVADTSKKLEKHYKVQANPRAINLFYLKDDRRERIEWHGERFEVLNTDIVFSKEELIRELKDFPDRFSPNVILRGIYQETLLPNIAFIGGGGELAYWLQLKDLFNHYQVPYPVLLLRNSFLILEKKWKEKMDRLGINLAEIFLTSTELLNQLVTKETGNAYRLNGSLQEVEKLYENFKQKAGAIDSTLAPHVEALKSRSLQSLQELEKKMLRAEKRKFSDQQRQIHVVKQKLFPNNSLQERVDNFGYFYARWGSSFIDELYKASPDLDGAFVTIAEN